MDDRALRLRYSQFRVLVKGKANAGKTTILQKVCNTTDQPKIYNSKGEKIDLSAVAPSRERMLLLPTVVSLYG
ncbi:hypothetical protein JAAARDRAFT_39110 [Jaapia argillacea MUCL 33604]|uniref:G domain-containing protein n=1 Tax=Jaapia argillacea MUCL 33604 TaxID=933084 RepID=A0A067PR65_9AGAM|nr:hypothetical protein JAAARDRAFT_39110 [Jaapia argillacea MUCL 33604]